jgi:hypothetical protein
MDLQQSVAGSAHLRRGPIKFPEYEPGGKNDAPHVDEPPPIDLPAPPIIDAGVKEFKKLAKLYWPDVKDGFKLSGFDVKNDRMLRYTLGLVYMAMRGVDR